MELPCRMCRQQKQEQERQRERWHRLQGQQQSRRARGRRLLQALLKVRMVKQHHRQQQQQRLQKERIQQSQAPPPQRMVKKLERTEVMRQQLPRPSPPGLVKGNDHPLVRLGCTSILRPRRPRRPRKQTRRRVMSRRSGRREKFVSRGGCGGVWGLRMRTRL